MDPIEFNCQQRTFGDVFELCSLQNNCQTRNLPKNLEKRLLHHPTANGHQRTC